MSDEKDHELQKKIAIAQIGASISTTLGAVIVTIAISFIFFSVGLNFEATAVDEGKSQFFKVSSNNFAVQGIILLVIGLLIIFSVLMNIAKIKKMK